MEYIKTVKNKKKGESKMRALQISLKAARINAGFTQEEVAKKLGKSTNTIIAWETGKSKPDIANTYLLSKIYKMDIDNIFFAM
jgi:conserved domain protein